MSVCRGTKKVEKHCFIRAVNEIFQTPGRYTVDQ